MRDRGQQTREPIAETISFLVTFCMTERSASGFVTFRVESEGTIRDGPQAAGSRSASLLDRHRQTKRIIENPTSGHFVTGQRKCPSTQRPLETEDDLQLTALQAAQKFQI